MTDPYRPLTQNEVRGLFTNSPHAGATISFPAEYPTVVTVLNRHGSKFEVNFTVGLHRFVQICEEFGVTLDPDAVASIPPMELRDARETEEAMEFQENAFDGKGPVETDITEELTEARQEAARAAKPKKK